MNRIFSLLIFFTCLGLFSQQMEVNNFDLSDENPPNEEDKSTVYFVRLAGGGGILAMLANYRYYDGEHYIGKFSTGGYIKYECEPGEHVFWVSATENKALVKIDLLPGKTYVLNAIDTYALAYGRVKLDLISTQGHNNPKKKKRIQNRYSTYLYLLNKIQSFHLRHIHKLIMMAAMFLLPSTP